MPPALQQRPDRFAVLLLLIAVTLHHHNSWQCDGPREPSQSRLRRSRYVEPHPLGACKDVPAPTRVVAERGRPIPSSAAASCGVCHSSWQPHTPHCTTPTRMRSQVHERGRYGASSHPALPDHGPASSPTEHAPLLQFLRLQPGLGG